MDDMFAGLDMGPAEPPVPAPAAEKPRSPEPEPPASAAISADPAPAASGSGMRTSAFGFVRAPPPKAATEAAPATSPKEQQKEHKEAAVSSSRRSVERAAPGSPSAQAQHQHQPSFGQRFSSLFQSKKAKAAAAAAKEQGEEPQAASMDSPATPPVDAAEPAQAKEEGEQKAPSVAATEASAEEQTPVAAPVQQPQPVPEPEPEPEPAVAVPEVSVQEDKQPETPEPQPEPQPEPEPPKSALEDCLSRAAVAREQRAKEWEALLREEPDVEAAKALETALAALREELQGLARQQEEAVGRDDYETAESLDASIQALNRQVLEKQADLMERDAARVGWQCKKAELIAAANEESACAEELRLIKESQSGRVQEIESAIKSREEEFDKETEKIAAEGEEERKKLAEMLESADEEEKIIKETAAETEAKIEEEESGIREKAAKLKDEIEELRRLLQEKEESLASLDADLERIESEKQEEKKAVGDSLIDLSSRRTEAKQKIQLIDDKIESRSVEKEHMKEELKSLETEKESITQELKQLDPELEKVSQSLEQGEATTAIAKQLKTIREEFLKRLLESKYDISKTNNEITKSKNSMTDISDRISSFQHDLIELRQKIAAADTLLPTLEQNKKALAAAKKFKEAAGTSQEIKTLLEKRTADNKQLEQLQADLSEMTDALKQHEVRCAGLEEHLGQIFLDYIKLKEEHSSATQNTEIPECAKNTDLINHLIGW